MKKKIVITLLIICSILSLCSCGKTQEYYTSIEQLEGKKVALWPGSKFEKYTTEVLPSAEQLALGEINVMAEALATGKIDSFGYDSAFLKFMNKQGYSFTYLPDYECELNYGFCFADTTNGRKYLSEFNEYLAEIKNSGKLFALQEEWIFSGNEQALKEPLNSWDCSKGTVKAYTTGLSMPFSYIYDNELSGYEVALLADFCKEKGYKLDAEIATFDAMLAGVQTGSVDLGFQTIEITEERQETMLFSSPTYTGSTVYYVLADPATKAKYSDLDELNGLKAALLVGSIDDLIVDERCPDSERLYFNTNNDCVLALNSGKADYCFADELTAYAFVESVDGIAVIDQSAYDQPIGAIFSKTSEKGQKLKTQFNKFVIEMKESGELDNLRNIWLHDSTTRKLPKRDFSGIEINIAINPTNIPYLFVSEEGYSGYEIELVEIFCEKYGYIPTYMNLDFSGILPSIQTEKADMAVAMVCKTEERTQSVDFSEIYTYEGMYAIVPTAGKNNDSFISSIKKSFYRTFIEENRWQLIVNGVFTTIEITLLSAIFGTIAGFIFYMLSRKNLKILNKILNILSRIIAGLPMVVILMIFYYLIFQKSNIEGVYVAIICFSLSIALSVYSDLRTSVLAIDNGQIEGAYSLGFTDIATFFRIVLPQAMQQFMPRYKANMIALINGTAVVGFIAVQDLTKMSDLIRARTYEAFFPLISTAIIYFILGALLTLVVKKIEFNFIPEKRSEEKILKKYK